MKLKDSKGLFVNGYQIYIYIYFYNIIGSDPNKVAGVAGPASILGRPSSPLDREGLDSRPGRVHRPFHLKMAATSVLWPVATRAK